VISEGTGTALRLGLAFVLLFALLLGSQALAVATSPTGGVASTGRVIGQTGFAYLAGLRTFAAAVLWNRLEPIFDGYYGSFDANFATFLPTMHLVTALDPQFQQAYYVTSFWLQRSGRSAEALAIAELGLKNNPSSGLLRANLAEILFIQGEGEVTPRLLELAREGISANVTWANTDDQFEGYGIFRAVFNKSGDKTTVDAIRKVQQILKDNGAAPGVSIEATSLPTPGLK
jgi:hypothetical protein